LFETELRAGKEAIKKEIATIFHVPIFSKERANQPMIETVSSKKTQPPANLPVGDYE
jgi:hypothetical protein